MVSIHLRNFFQSINNCSVFFFLSPQLKLLKTPVASHVVPRLQVSIGHL